MWLLLVIIGTTILGYIIYTIISTYGHEFKDTSIDAFIIEESEEEKMKGHLQKEDPYARRFETMGKQILVLYGTEYGFSEEIAKVLFDTIENVTTTTANVTEDDPWQPRLINMRHCDFIDLSQEQFLLAVISTAGDGVPPTDARRFCEQLGEMKEDLSHLKFSVLALGDSNYIHYCRAGKTVDSRLAKLGARRVVSLQDVDTEDWGSINSWLELVMRSLSTVQLVSKLDYLDIPETSDDSHPSRSRPFMATLKVKYNVTQWSSDDDKETIHCELDITGSNISWCSGDAVGIFADNNPNEIERLVHAMKATGTELVDVPKWASTANAGEKSTLCAALKTYYDLKNVKPELLQFLQKCADTHTSREEMNKLLKNGISRTNTILHEYLHEREVCDVLLEFGDIVKHILPSEILKYMRSLQPRYYSISSSPVVNRDTCCVTAAIIRYSTLGLKRTGVCTTFLQDRLKIGQMCPVFISQNPEFRLPVIGSTDIIMVGPGTGLAPFMAFIFERLHTKAVGKNRLYFGCRHRNSDFLYGKQLEKWEKDELITLRTAFSRDQAHKVYVQDRLREDACSLWTMIAGGAHVYICGDAKHMAHDVHEALLFIVREQAHINVTEAEEYIRTMEKEGRYQKDVWVA